MSRFFELTLPECPPRPVLVEVPHAGMAVPDVAREHVLVSRRDLERDSDIYVDKLFHEAPTVGAALLSSVVSRYVVDLNRAPDDVDAETVEGVGAGGGEQPRGVVWRLTTTGRPVLPRPLKVEELRERLELFHTPYHATIESQLAALRERFGHAILLAAHSMPSVGRAARPARPMRRADIVPGTRGRTTADARIIDLIDAHFREAGLSVRHDDPYRGGYSTGRYGQPGEGWHAVQIEINRDLYVNESTAKPNKGDFEELAALLVRLVERLGTLAL